MMPILITAFSTQEADGMLTSAMYSNQQRRGASDVPEGNAPCSLHMPHPLQNKFHPSRGSFQRCELVD